MIVCRIRSSETRYAAAHPASSGSRPIGCRVVSKAKTIDASSARDAPANIAAMPTSAGDPQIHRQRRDAAPLRRAAEQRAEAAADGEQRRQRSARRAAAERHRPGDRT